MEEKPLRKIVGENLTELRKKKGLTQYAVAQLFGYSDKAVSKWENGDTLPDLETLTKIASYYSVTLDYLVHQGKEKEVYKVKEKPKANRKVIIILACTIPLLLSAIAFTVLYLYRVKHFWLTSFYWVPIDFLLVFIFSWIWKEKKLRTFSGILLTWTLLSSLFVSLYVIFPNKGYMFWPLFFIGIPLTLALLFWLKINSPNHPKTK